MSNLNLDLSFSKGKEINPNLSENDLQNKKLKFISNIPMSNFTTDTFLTKQNLIFVNYENGHNILSNSHCLCENLMLFYKTEELGYDLNGSFADAFSFGVIDLFGIRSLYDYRIQSVKKEDDFLYNSFKNSIIFVPDLNAKNLVEEVLKMINSRATLILISELTVPKIEEIVHASIHFHHL